MASTSETMPPILTVPVNASTRRLRLLCLDGGGVRGLSSLLILEQLLKRVGSPKPCEYFDMICGVSSGGLIALMLGVLQMTIEDAQEAFASLMDDVFVRRHFKPFTFTGSIQARYSSSNLEANIKKLIVKSGIPQTALVRREKKVPCRCRTFVLALAQNSGAHVLFSDYERQDELSYATEATIWEAARATSAATTFFKPVVITHRNVEYVFSDGGFGENNPIKTLWHEARQLFGSDLEPQIQTLLSIGTGKPPTKGLGDSLKDVYEALKRTANETETTAREFERDHEDLIQRGGYFRFNVPDISEFGIADVKQRTSIAQITEAYLMNEPFKLKSFVASNTGVTSRTAPQIAPAPKLLIAAIPSQARRFYSLGSGEEYLKPPMPEYYWRRLTLKSYKIYEVIYNACKSDDGTVHFESFIQQFEQGRTSREKVAKYWGRLLRREQPLVASLTRHPKSFTLATLYMMHTEQFDPARPRGETGREGEIKNERREKLKRYNNWVVCRCGQGCGLEWNFSNDVGIHAPEKPDAPCPIAKLVSGQKTTLNPSAKYPTLLEHMRDAWPSGCVSRQ